MIFENATQQVVKAVTDAGAKFDAAVTEFSNLQNKGREQANAFVEVATRMTQEQLAFAEQMAAEWRKMMLAATRNVAEIFTPKS